MKKIKLPILILVIAIAIIAIISISVAVAFMFRKTQPINNVFIPAEVDCKINEVFNGKEKTSINVQNTGNIESYIRMRIVTYWQDSKGNVVARSSEALSFSITDDWFKVGDVYYYKHPVEAGAQTNEFLASGSKISLKKVDEKVDDVIYTYYQVVELLAEAIQSKPTNVVKETWEAVQVDENGDLQALPSTP